MSFEEDQRAPSFDDQAQRLRDGLPTLPNTPGFIGGPNTNAVHRAIKSATVVQDNDTDIEVTMLDKAGTFRATLMLPADYNIQDCIGPTTENDELEVMQLSDGQWMAPGPWIPKDWIKDIFACP